jgi:hypothetical protein
LAHENDLVLDWLKNAWHYRLKVKLDVIGAHSSGHYLTLCIGFTLVVQLETLAGDWGGASFKCNREVNILRNETSIEQFLNALIQIAFFDGSCHRQQEAFIFM